MNVFKVLASGKHRLREEFVSAFLAYLLSPHMDHGLGSAVLAALLEEIAEKQPNSAAGELASSVDDPFQVNLFADERIARLETEFRVQTADGRHEFIDVLVRRDKWLFLIENKIDSRAQTKGQLERQFRGLQAAIGAEEVPEMSIGAIYLVPAVRKAGGWSVLESSREEVGFSAEAPNFVGLMTWQETGDLEVPSFAGAVQSIFEKESKGVLSPLSGEIRTLLLAFLNFINEEFTGYTFERRVSDQATTSYSVAELLAMNDEEIYVGIRYGLGGLIWKAWKDEQFRSQHLNVSEGPNGWQYLSLSQFKKVATWAMNPTSESLEGVEWRGKPFSTCTLYLVSKANGVDLYIGMRGGLDSLKRMSAEEIASRDSWEISNEKRTSSWFSAKEYCQVLEEKGVVYDGPSKEVAS